MSPPILLSSLLILGLWTSTQADLSTTTASIFIAVAAICALIAATMRMRRGASVLLALCAVCIGLGLGSLQMHQARTVVLPDGSLAGRARLICEGRVVAGPLEREQSISFDVRLTACRLPTVPQFQQSSGTVRVYARETITAIMPGDRIRFQAKFRRPRDFRNGGGFSHTRYLLARGIGAIGMLAGPEWLVALPDSRENMAEKLYRMRRRIDDAVATSLEGKETGVVRALVAGKREAVNDEVRRAFQRAGVAHLLAISGLHVGYVALFIYAVVWLLCGRWSALLVRIPLQRLAAGFSLPLIWGCIALIGAPVSAVRAGIMVSVYLVGMLLGRRQDLLTTLAIAALIVVVLQPLSIFEVSFQLSFVSVLSIIVMVPRLMGVVRPWFSFRRAWHWRALYRIIQLVAVTIAATIGAAPLVAYHFYSITGAGLIANLFAVPWVGLVILPLAAVASCVTFIWLPAAQAVLWPLVGGAVHILIRWTELISGIASPVVVAIAPHAYEVVLIYALLATLVFWCSIPYRRIVLAVLSIAMLLNVAWWQLRPLMNDNLEVTFLDAGQGDAALVRFPGGRTMLVDGGGLPSSSFDVGEHVVVPALLSRGIHHIDWMVLSHPHHDHYRGLAAVAEYFRPNELWTNGTEAPPEELDFWRETLDRIERVGVTTRVVDASASPVEIGGVTMAILYPRQRPPDDLDLNDGSLVIKLSYGEVSFLFTGDLMAWGERSLIDTGSVVTATVLKVGHHGSETSSTRQFLEAVNPRTAVISVGRDNAYGVPDAVVLDRLDNIGALVYRTDLHGAVTVTTDGHHMDVSTVVDE